MSSYFVFSEFDNPMYLSKVGNWVITFLSARDAAYTELSVTSVVPRQNQHILQPRRLVLLQSNEAHTWEIKSLECYNSETQCDELVELDSIEAQQTFQQIMQEFAKYDVDILLK